MTLQKVQLRTADAGQAEGITGMHKRVRSFLKSEDGAVTVDWVVLTAAILGIQIVVLIATMEDSMVEVSTSIGNEVSEYEDFLD